MKGWYGNKQQHSLASRGIGTKDIKYEFKRWNERIDIDHIREIYNRSYMEIKRDAGVGDIVTKSDGEPEEVDGYEYEMIYLPKSDIFASVWHMDEGSEDEDDDEAGNYTSIVFMKINKGKISIQDVYKSHNRQGIYEHLYGHFLSDAIRQYYNEERIGVW